MLCVGGLFRASILAVWRRNSIFFFLAARRPRKEKKLKGGIFIQTAS